MKNSATLSSNTRVTLLLCGRFGEHNSEARPLNQSEFHELDHALEACQLAPENILDMTPAGLKEAGVVHGISTKRLTGLMARNADLEETIKAWSKSGIWVLGERDKLYPARLRQRLTSARPPLLFGAGAIDCLDMGGVCIVGSRASGEPALQFSAALGKRSALEGLTVISNDMRGVDREAVTSALEGSGKAIIVLSDRLEKAVAAKRYRDSLANNQLTMVTPFSPNAAFSVANAIRLNRYQYVLSDVAVIVETRRKGGVWTGADENRIEKWVPAFVRADQPMSPGNIALLHLGLQAITQQDVENIDSLGDFFISKVTKGDRNSLPPMPNSDELISPTDLYSFFLAKFSNIASNIPQTETYIMKYFDIELVQARKWLDRAVAEGIVKKVAGKNSYISLGHNRK
jgi:predicted Rossmann fold nucleotide-binding protein DprA/Smf involved in DNA uptake